MAHSDRRVPRLINTKSWRWARREGPLEHFFSNCMGSVVFSDVELTEIITPLAPPSGSLMLCRMHCPASIFYTQANSRICRINTTLIGGQTKLPLFFLFWHFPFSCFFLWCNFTRSLTFTILQDPWPYFVDLFNKWLLLWLGLVNLAINYLKGKRICIW